LPRKYAAQDLHRLMSHNSDEQMPFGPILLVMTDGMQAQFRLEAAEDRSKSVSMV
jgi:hypothetical protein